jgi:hypothetical protein
MCISYYKLGNVCVSVCVSVCPAIRFYISQRIYSKFGGNLLRVMPRSVGYIVCVCTQRARVRVQCARINRVRMLNWRSLKLIIASGSFIVTVYWTVLSTPNGQTGSLQICWERTTTHHKCQGLRTIHVYAPCVRVRARMCESVRD